MPAIDLSLLRRYLLRRAALRAVSASPSTTVVASKPRTFTSLTSNTFRPRQQQWLVAHQRRFNSDDAARPTEENTTDETVTESRSESEQAAAEENSTSSSAYDAASSAAETVAEKTQQAGAAALESAAGLGNAAAAAFGGGRQFKPSSEDSNKTLYVGNLFFQTSDDQLRQEFARFGNIVKTTIIRDPAGLSRGYVLSPVLLFPHCR